MLTTIDQYIQQFDPAIQSLLNQMRNTIKESAPEATEALTYGMPTFKLNGNLVHFAANKNHIGFYPAPSGIIKFGKELSEYKTSKGAIQFSYDKPLPLDLVANITRFRVEENKC